MPPPVPAPSAPDEPVERPRNPARQPPKPARSAHPLADTRPLQKLDEAETVPPAYDTFPRPRPRSFGSLGSRPQEAGVTSVRRVIELLASNGDPMRPVS